MGHIYKQNVQEEMEVEVDQFAPAAIDDTLDLFSLLPENVGVLQRKWVIANPVNSSIDSDTVIEFNVDGNASRYIDLRNS